MKAPTIGERFGMLVVLELAPSDGKNKRFVCVCDCGNVKAVANHHLTQGRMKSCGCGRIKHGHCRSNTRSHEFTVWNSMRQRCNNPHSKRYKDYGGRGITVDSKWDNFEAFLADMGTAPAGYELDRIDNDKGYSKENCKWSTPKEQCRNRRSNTFLTHNGRTMIAADWAKELGVPNTTLHSALSSGHTLSGFIYRLEHGLKNKKLNVNRIGNRVGVGNVQA